MRNVLFMISPIVFVAIFICGCAKHSLTEQQIIQIANTKADSEGLLKGSNIYYDVDNKIWLKTFASLKKDNPDYIKERDNFNVLKGHDYQTVIYTPKNPSTLGGILYVFVDRNNGEVITIYGEE